MRMTAKALVAESSAAHLSRSCTLNPFPLQEVVATDSGEQRCEQVGEQVLRMLQACSPSPRSKAELLAVAGLANAYLNDKRHILPLLRDGLLKWTVPDTPNRRR